jgi:hypothetical protein
MQYIFEIEDEKTITNETVKVIVTVSGPANLPRTEIEKQVREVLHDFLPDADWSYAGLQINKNAGFPTYNSKAGARIKASENGDLYSRAQDYSSPEATININNIDESIPLYQRREADKELRIALYTKALAEIETLAEVAEGELRIRTIDYTAISPTSNAGKFSNSYSTANAALVGDAVDSIGYSEKITMSARVVIIDGEDLPTAEIVEG